jgi:hypothetical protein
VLLPALAAQISTHSRRVGQLQARRQCRFECTETTETLELPVARWVKIAWRDDPVMFVHPAGNEPVPVLKAVVETAVVRKTRTLSGGAMLAVGGFDDGGVLSSVERYDEAKEQWEVIASMGSERYGRCVCFGWSAVRGGWVWS